VRLALVLSVLVGCVVMRPPWVDERPRWQLVDPGAQLDTACVIGRAFVRKSGKQGIGIALQLRSRETCHVTFTAARLELAGGKTIEVAPPASRVLPGRSLVYTWWPVRFDNNAVWNRGHHDGELVLDYAIGGVTGSWRVAMRQAPPPRGGP
jgi:hypothetical protein